MKFILHVSSFKRIISLDPRLGQSPAGLANPAGFANPNHVAQMKIMPNDQSADFEDVYP